MYLLDTDILSADAPAKRRVGANAFSAWVRAHADHLHLAAITVAEIEAGIVRAARSGAAAKAGWLRLWLDVIEQLCGARILPFGIAEARAAGAILDAARAHDPGFEDIAIAATAAVRGFTVRTANERHFAPLGVALREPAEAASMSGFGMVACAASPRRRCGTRTLNRGRCSLNSRGASADRLRSIRFTPMPAYSRV